MIEKKLKPSAEKIVMPDKLKERILKKCDTAENQADEEITFTVEPFRQHRIIRIISRAATIAVAVGITGYSGYSILRNSNFSDTGNITEQSSYEVMPVDVPLGNLNGNLIKFNGYKGIIPACVLDEIQSQKISEFFRTVEWEPISTDSPEILADCADVGGVTSIDFYYNTADGEYPVEYLTVRLNDGIVSYTIDEYKDGQLVSGYNYFYKINAEDFLDNIISLLYGDGSTAPPFDVSALKYCVKEQDSRNLSAEETAMITDAFYGWNWSDEIYTSPENEPAYIFTDGKAFEIAVYENDTVTVKNDEEYHCYSDVSGNGGTLYTYLKIMLKDDVSVYMNDFLPFGDFASKEYLFEGEIIPEKKRFEIADFFNRQIWKNIDTPTEDYNGIIAYKFTAKGSITIYSEGILEYTDENGSFSYYEIDFDLFNTTLSSILYGEECTGKDIFFTENDGSTVTFSGYRNFIHECELNEIQTEKMTKLFSGLKWQETEKPEIKGGFYPSNDTVSFVKKKDGLTYTLSFSMNNLNLATYTVYGMIPTENEINTQYETKYFSINENIIREAINVNFADGMNMYAPFGTLYKMTNSLHCESELYTGKISGDKLKSLSTAFLGWDWSDASYTMIEGFPEYTFSYDNFTLYVFADGSVVCDSTDGNVYYNNVDGDDDPKRRTGDLCLMIEEVLTDNNPVIKIQ